VLPLVASFVLPIEGSLALLPLVGAQGNDLSQSAEGIPPRCRLPSGTITACHPSAIATARQSLSLSHPHECTTMDWGGEQVEERRLGRGGHGFIGRGAEQGDVCSLLQWIQREATWHSPLSSLAGSMSVTSN
jgi:hypothetical protein